jgi:outer membrane protein OmpA-like peptidoglycan-associated protein
MTAPRFFLPLFLAMALGFGTGAVTGCHGQAQVKVGATEPPPAAPPPPQVQLRGVQLKTATQIDMPGDVEYQKGSAKVILNDKSKKVLTQVAQILKDNPEITSLRVEGHTDNAGEKKGFDNKKLSTERAQAVADWLNKNGVDPNRLTVVGWGSAHPLAANDTSEHMAENRRMEFHVQEFNGKPVAEAATSTLPDNAAASEPKAK